MVPQGLGSKAGCILNGYSSVIPNDSDAFSFHPGDFYLRDYSRTGPLPDKFPLMILVHLVGFRSQNQAVSIEHNSGERHLAHAPLDPAIVECDV